MTPGREPVAFLGIGTMGHGMATSALRAGIPTVVWNRNSRGNPRPRRSWRGGRRNPRRRSATGRHCRHDGDGRGRRPRDRQRPGHARGARADSIWVQMSTIGVAGIERVRALADSERPDVTLIDAPVSGSKDPAEQGELTVFASGPDEARSRLDPLFDALGQRTIWVGPVGAGSRLKLVANAWLALGAEAVNTSVALARRLGLETETVANALRGGPLVSPWQAAKLQRIAQGDFSVQFALSLALKDVHLAIEAADAGPFVALACLADEWQHVVDQGLGEQDITVVTQALEQFGN